MAPTSVNLEYIKDLPLYDEEKPYWCFVSPRADFDPDSQRLDNLEFAEHSVELLDLRGREAQAKLDERGFEIAYHESQCLQFETIPQIEAYKRETEEHLSDFLGAVFVKCYDSCLRKNVTFERSQFDIADPLLKQGPAQGVHIGKNVQITDEIGWPIVDITFDSGPEVITRYLSVAEQKRYLRPGYRIRILKYVSQST